MLSQSARPVWGHLRSVAKRLNKNSPQPGRAVRSRESMTSHTKDEPPLSPAARPVWGQLKEPRTHLLTLLSQLTFQALIQPGKRLQGRSGDA